MTNKKVKSKVSRNIITPIVAAVAGAVVAGAVIMSDKKNQDKINKVVSNVKKSIKDKKALIVNKANKLEDIRKNTINEVKNI